MSKPSTITQTDLDRMAIIAIKRGVLVSMKDGKGRIFSVSPDMRDLSAVDQSTEIELDRELAAFEAKNGHG